MSRGAGGGTSRGVSVPLIFDSAARRLRRDRAAARFADADFLRAFMLEGITDRLAMVTRPFARVLDLGCFDGGFAVPGAEMVRCDAGAVFAARAGGVQCDEDALTFEAGSFDLVVSAGVLDTVNDLPGALVQIRRVLKADGLFLGAMAGAGSLPALRAAFREAEQERPAARFHPQIDVRSAGDLLMRAGFALPVADTEPLDVRYSSMGRLLDDLRGNAATNVLSERAPLSRTTLARAAAAFAGMADANGRTHERYEVLFLTGWAPDPSQPKPARRGSAVQSLADALKPGGAA